MIKKLIIMGLIGTCLFFRSSYKSYAFDDVYTIHNEEPTIIEVHNEYEQDELPELVPPLIIEEPEPSSLYSDEDIDLLARITLAEAEGESEEGKRLVIDTILNRVDSPNFANSIRGVIYEKRQFTSIHNGRIDRMIVNDYIVRIVKEELGSRTNDDVIYFRTKHYHSCGVALFKCGNHYFSRER